MPRSVFRGPFGRRTAGPSPRAEALAAWVLAYGASLLCVMVTMAAAQELGRLLHLTRQGWWSENVWGTALVVAPTLCLALKLRRTWLALLLPAVPIVALAARQIAVYCRLELPRVLPNWGWAAKDLAFWPYLVCFTLLGLYVARTFVHTYLRHPSLEPTWGRAGALPGRNTSAGASEATAS